MWLCCDCVWKTIAGWENKQLSKNWAGFAGQDADKKQSLKQCNRELSAKCFPYRYYGTNFPANLLERQVELGESLSETIKYHLHLAMKTPLCGRVGENVRFGRDLLLKQANRKDNR